MTSSVINTGGVAAGQCLTQTHVKQDLNGKVKIVVEYTLG